MREGILMTNDKQELVILNSAARQMLGFVSGEKVTVDNLPKYVTNAGALTTFKRGSALRNIHR